MARVHALKTLPKYFAQLRVGWKTAEVRKDDRQYTAGDWLVLMEWTPEEEFTGEVEVRRISCVSDLTGLVNPSAGEEDDGWRWVLLSFVPSKTDDWKRRP